MWRWPPSPRLPCVSGPSASERCTPVLIQRVAMPRRPRLAKNITTMLVYTIHVCINLMYATRHTRVFVLPPARRSVESFELLSPMGVGVAQAKVGGVRREDERCTTDHCGAHGGGNVTGSLYAARCGRSINAAHLSELTSMTRVDRASLGAPNPSGVLCDGRGETADATTYECQFIDTIRS